MGIMVYSLLWVVQIYIINRISCSRSSQILPSPGARDAPEGHAGLQLDMGSFPSYP